MHGPASALARAFLAAGSVLILVASITGGTVAATAFVVVVALFPVALIALAKGPSWVLLGLGVLLLGGSIAVLLLPSAAWMLLGLGLAPLLLVTWGYAATARTD